MTDGHLKPEKQWYNGFLKKQMMMILGMCGSIILLCTFVSWYCFLLMMVVLPIMFFVIPKRGLVKPLYDDCSHISITHASGGIVICLRCGKEMQYEKWRTHQV